jgi:hypothetical protein
VVLAPKSGEKESAEDYKSRIRTLCQFSVVQEMWGVVNLMNELFADNSSPISVHVHRDDILPMWEDSLNKDGGSLVMGFSKQQFSEVMEKFFMLYCGHQLSEYVTGHKDQYSSTGFSIHLNKRRFEHTVEVWTGSYSMSEGEIWEQGFRSFFRLMCGDCPRQVWPRQVEVEKGEWFSTRVNWMSHVETAASAVIAQPSPQNILKPIEANKPSTYQRKPRISATGGRSTPGFLV